MIRVFDEAGNVTEAHEQYLSELPLQILRFEKLFATDRRGISRFLELALILFIGAAL
jgi:hypothetical protein